MSETCNAVDWCDQTLREWEVITQELFEIRFSGDAEPSILRKARINRAEKKKATADVKASMALMIQDVMRSTDRGAVTLEIPEISLDVRMNWHERLPAAS